MIFVLWSFLSKQNKEEDNNLLESFIFSSLLLYMKKNELILKSSVKVIQESWSQMMLQKVKKSQQSLLSTPDTKFHGRVSKINEPPSCYMVCQQVTSLAESFFSKFHNCPQSFASQQNIQFFWTISQQQTLSAYIAAAWKGSCMYMNIYE